MNLMLLFFVKIIDSLLGTAKTILIQKEKELIAAITVTITQFLFFKVVSQVITSNDPLTIWLVSIAAGIGVYLAMQIDKKLSKDRIYISNILSDDKDAMIELSNYLKQNKIKNMITNSYTKDWGETLAIIVYADTKDKQTLVTNFVNESENKYLQINN